ncbi:diguanylate cyclase [Catenovulum sp. SM1970]|uniref:sensor domain-containing diguanylate cyclase n=1 Tax=Marinifaba aquimaris TaxID=2741323 RepID=UPI0015724BBE|nr:diguanylate cyclase [Marinifaba aquimaris]NTS76952.1 diguanylate cyclase [Marinifaba aquimaris]
MTINLSAMRLLSLMAMFVPFFSLAEPLSANQQFFSSGVNYGLFFGFMLAVLLSNTVLYLMTKSRTFIYYTGVLATALLLILSWEPNHSGYLSNNWSWLKQDAAPSLLMAMLAFTLLFSNRLLHFKATAMLFHKGALLGVLILTVLAILVTVLPHTIALNIAFVGAVISALWLVAGMLYQIRTLQPSFRLLISKFYLVAVLSSSLVFGYVYLTAEKLPMLSALISGVFIHSLTLMIILGYGYGRDKRIKIEAQTEALEQAKQASQAQQALLELQQSQQEELEASVQERTFELEVTLRELEDKNRELEEKNTLDSLTGLRNRSYFDKKLLAEYRRSRREQTVLSLVMFDIDHFKNVNDTYGHPAGDDVIRVVASLASQVAKRPTDIVCRYGGEEFSMILPCTDSPGAYTIAEKLRAKLASQPIHTCAGPIDITVSFGVASMLGNRQQSEASLLQYADDALYQAKKNGRDQVWLSEEANLEAS